MRTLARGTAGGIEMFHSGCILEKAGGGDVVYKAEDTSVAEDVGARAG
jgi:hypothetical protein